MLVVDFYRIVNRLNSYTDFNSMVAPIASSTTTDGLPSSFISELNQFDKMTQEFLFHSVQFLEQCFTLFLYKGDEYQYGHNSGDTVGGPE